MCNLWFNGLNCFSGATVKIEFTLLHTLLIATISCAVFLLAVNHLDSGLCKLNETIKVESSYHDTVEIFL